MFRPFQGKPLPLATPSTSRATVQIYDPAMCCSTGVCGPSVDPTLLQVTRDLRWLEAQGITVERFNLAQQPGAFVAQPRVAGLLQAFGEQALPVTLVNESILIYGRYPSREELTQAVRAPQERPSTPSSTGGCCEPGSDCCS